MPEAAPGGTILPPPGQNSPAEDANPSAGLFGKWDTPADITLTLPMPPSANAMHANRTPVWSERMQCWYSPPRRSKPYAKWLADVEWLGIAQSAADRITDQYAMRVTAPPSRKDLDNLVKPLSDGLQRMRVVPNDKHAQAIMLRLDPLREGLGVLVELWALS